MKPWPLPFIGLDNETLAGEDIKTLSLPSGGLGGHGSGAIFCCINSEREKTDVDKKRWVWGAAHQLADLYPCLIIWPNISSYNQAPGPSPPVQMNEWGVGALDNVWAQHTCNV